MANEKKVKERFIGARFDTDEGIDIDNYVAAYNAATGNDITVTDVVRRGMREFMQNHPIKAPTTTVRTQPGKPGE